MSKFLQNLSACIHREKNIICQHSYKYKQHIAILICQKYVIVNIFISADQGCIYLIKKYSKTLILWIIINCSILIYLEM